MNIIFITSEAYPFIKTGGLGDVCGALPLALEKLGLNVSIFLPKYGSIKFQDSPEIVDENCSRVKIGKNISVYLIEHADFFASRSGVYGENDRDYPDNLERFQYFCSETLKVMDRLNLPVDILHCHDWQSALIPVYWKELFRNHPRAKQIKTVMTIHNLAFQGVFPSEKYVTLGLDRHLFTVDGFEFYNQVNLLKAGLLWSDQITTVSPRYAWEIQTKEFGCGLQDILQKHGESIRGILNGLDYDWWNPRTDAFLDENYFGNIRKFKSQNKMHLQKLLHLNVSSETPLVGFVARLSHQKGLDLILDTIDDLMKKDCQLVIQGTGSPDYHRRLMEKAAQYSENLSVCLRFDESLAHQIYAGSDFFIMPSTFEPCGLGQMIALRYGSLPIVFKTGGLADTVVSSRDNADLSTGFVFDQYRKIDFLVAVEEAIAVYKKTHELDAMIERAMSTDFSWTQSAQEYKRMYEWLLLA